MTGSAAPYERFYRGRDPRHVYPVEFVVRAFLGEYPRLPRFTPARDGERILDLGFGDGRNMPLLAHLGLDVHGVEITQDICDRTAARMQALDVPITARVGRNASIPYGDAFFDHVLACHSCYYVDEGSTFDDNLREIARVQRPGARFVLSAPITTSYIFEGAQDLGHGHRRIARDPYGVREGTIMRAFGSAGEIESALAPLFEDVRVGSCRNDFWGIDEHVWTAVCRRRAS